MRSILLALLALATPGLAAAPDPLRDRLIADAKLLAPATMSFDRASSATQTAKSGESEVERRSDRWTGKSWTLLTINGKPASAEDSAKYAKTAAEQIVPGYYRIGLFLSGAAAKTTDAQGRTVYHLDAMPKDSIKIGGDVSDKMAADITIDSSGPAPYAARLHIYAKAPFRVMLVAKIDSFDIVSDYARGADGKPVATRSVNTIKGSQFGTDGTQRSESVISNVRYTAAN